MAKRSKHELSLDIVEGKRSRRERSERELPIDIIIYEILTRLPVKTLSRFRAVSKSWCSIISQPDFQKEHRLRSQKCPLLLVNKDQLFSTYCNEGGTFLREFTMLPKLRAWFPINSCLGLVCFDLNGGILVCNPSTEEILILPSVLPKTHMHVCVGFGYVTSTEEFKVLRFFTLSAEHEDCHCEVYALGTSDGWRDARSPPPFMPYTYGNLPLLHGALHFLPSWEYHPQELDHYIAAFHLDKEEYTQIPLPGNYFAEIYLADQWQLAESRGSLCMAFDFSYEKTLQIWLLKDYHSTEWVKEYNILLISVCSIRFPIVFSEEGSILLDVRSSPEQPHKLCSFSPKENRIVNTIGIDSSGAIYYIESFFPLGTR